MRLAFALVLTLYALSATEMHDWVRIPDVVVHMLEHHSELGHTDAPDHHDDEHGHDHDPFADCCANEFCACGGAAFITTLPQFSFSAPLNALVLTPVYIESNIDAFSGSKWNPPRLA